MASPESSISVSSAMRAFRFRPPPEDLEELVEPDGGGGGVLSPTCGDAFGPSVQG